MGAFRGKNVKKRWGWGESIETVKVATNGYRTQVYMCYHIGYGILHDRGVAQCVKGYRTSICVLPIGYDILHEVLHYASIVDCKRTSETMRDVFLYRFHF